MDLKAPSEPPPDYITAAASHGIRLRQSAPPKKGPLPLDLPILSYLKSKRVILASASPRRKALLAQVCVRILSLVQLNPNPPVSAHHHQL